MRLVLDTNVVVSGLIWGGVPRRLLDLARDGYLSLFTSNVLLDELADVLAREKFAPLLASQRITPALLMQGYSILAKSVTPQGIQRTVRDPKDDAVIATALVAQAEAVITGDNDLLVLHPWQRIQILNPAQALQLIE